MSWSGPVRMTMDSLREAPARTHLKIFLCRVVPPVTMFLLARWRLWRSAEFAGADPAAAGSWGRWDTAHYFSIAQRGYEFFSCARVPGYDPSLDCGNAAWLPGYPLLMRFLVWLFHVDIAVAGALISAVCALTILLVLWNCFLGAEMSIAAWLTLALAAFFPGHVYHHAIFPVALCAALHGLALYAYVSRRFLWAGVASALAAFTYSSGVFIAAVFALHLLVSERGVPWPQRIRHLCATAGVTALGFVAFLLLLQIEVGTWAAYFRVQAKYAYQPTWPWMAVLHHAGRATLTGSGFTNIQTAFVALLACALLVAAILPPRRRSHDGVLSLFLVVYWCVPLALGGALSLYRSEALLISAVPLARKLPTPVIALLVALAFLIAARMDVLFFKNSLV